MVVKVRLRDVFSQRLMVEKGDHIRTFLEQEGIAIDPDDLGATEMSERQVKELMEELADDLPGG